MRDVRNVRPRNVELPLSAHLTPLEEALACDKGDIGPVLAATLYSQTAWLWHGIASNALAVIWSATHDNPSSLGWLWWRSGPFFYCHQAITLIPSNPSNNKWYEYLPMRAPQQLPSMPDWASMKSSRTHGTCGHILAAAALDGQAEEGVPSRRQVFPLDETDDGIKNQVGRAQDYLRKLTEPVIDYLWGTEWDVLYLGHCGDRYGPSVSNVHFPRLLGNAELDNIPLWYLRTHATRTASRPPIHSACVYNQAAVLTCLSVTKKGAEKIINLSHDAKAIDTRMGRACKNGTMRCFTVNPELLHHHIPAGQAPSEIQTKQDVSAQAWTPNILHSARCNLDRGDDELVSCPRPDS
ncbi:hypothetical protein KC328_g115 [Hortaea werneckii]|nr:hypothetical protein KC328_g115 [Hortaea werneckii]